MSLYNALQSTTYAHCNEDRIEYKNWSRHTYIIYVLTLLIFAFNALRAFQNVLWENFTKTCVHKKYYKIHIFFNFLNISGNVCQFPPDEGNRWRCYRNNLDFIRYTFLNLTITERHSTTLSSNIYK